VPAGNHPATAAISPDGRSSYVTDYGDDDVNQYDVGSGGLLRPKSAPTVRAGTWPGGVMVLPDQAPEASFTTTSTPSATHFDGSLSTDPDGTVARYDWDFGDGTTGHGAGPTPAHIYAAAGTYVARLTVTDDQGCSTSEVFTGQTAYCNGGSAATMTATIVVPAETIPSPTLPRCSIQAVGRQKGFARQGTIVTTVSCDREASVVETGTLTVQPRRSRAGTGARRKRKPVRRYALTGTSAGVVPGHPRQLLVRLPAHDRPEVVRALRRHATVSVSLSLTARGFGPRSIATATISPLKTRLTRKRHHR
jgi:hypothetical protein